MYIESTITITEKNILKNMYEYETEIEVKDGNPPKNATEAIHIP